MRHTFRILVAMLLWSEATVAGVRKLPKEPPDASVDIAQSAALFVGVRDFPHDRSLTEVRYAVDDAVDLAFVLAIDERTRLVDPKRVILALSGHPQKKESSENLTALLAAGASRKPAGVTDVLRLLEDRSRTVGKNGVLVIAFATHGMTEEGTQYLLTENSLLQHRETKISETKVRDIVSRAGVARSLILLDACRQRLTSDTRAGDADPRSAAALMRSLSELHGQVVLSAAAPGEYAYDDDVRRNGVFTAAVMDGLRCGATADDRGFVTVDALATYVENQVLSWVQKHRDPDVKRATQLHSEGKSKLMPLSRCPNQ